MDRNRKIALGAATLAVALGAGHLVQSHKHGTVTTASATDVARAEPAKPTRITPLAATAVPDTTIAAPAPSATAAAQPAPAGPKVALPAPTPGATAAIPPMPGDTRALGPVLASTTPDVAPGPVTGAPAAAVPQADACRATLDVIPAANAMLEITLLAPCMPSARVVLHHGGLAVTGRTSTGGALFTSLPAMESSGEVSARFADGSTAQGAAPIDLRGLRRFAIQWMADDRFALNAYAGGAAWGEPGHVHDGASGRPQDKSGWLVALGDASVDLPLMAEVYTWPAATADVTIDLEAAVTDATCDRELLGETLDSEAGKVTHGDITLAMPGCDAVGDTLVLNNLLTGMTTAAAE